MTADKTTVMPSTQSQPPTEAPKETPTEAPKAPKKGKGPNEKSRKAYKGHIEKWETYEKARAAYEKGDLYIGTFQKVCSAFQWQWRLAHNGEKNPEYSANITKTNRENKQLVMETGNTQSKTYALHTEETVHEWYEDLMRKIKKGGKIDQHMRELLLFYIMLISGPPRRLQAYACTYEGKPCNNYLNMKTWTLHVEQYKTKSNYGAVDIDVGNVEKFNVYHFSKKQIDDTRTLLEKYFESPEKLQLFKKATDTAAAILRMTDHDSTNTEIRKSVATTLHFTRPATDHYYAPLWGHSIHTHQTQYMLRDAHRKSVSRENTPEPQERESTPPPPQRPPAIESTVVSPPPPPKKASTDPMAEMMKRMGDMELREKRAEERQQQMMEMMAALLKK
ncbi:hypothetical protein KIPB_005196 [Kipferlia bialata]|uniref:Uncharacterized protein n=1 Tax=Kipferlia bialata TaxID=797122 RepID=A0A391NW23_9EUKA|nr:hypothetical protein KIPB_005196 [Kipferlia bialata]|eukprot:g5196.t1